MLIDLFLWNITNVLLLVQDRSDDIDEEDVDGDRGMKLIKFNNSLFKFETSANQHSNSFWLFFLSNPGDDDSDEKDFDKVERGLKRIRASMLTYLKKFTFLNLTSDED